MPALFDAELGPMAVCIERKRRVGPFWPPYRYVRSFQVHRFVLFGLVISWRVRPYDHNRTGA